MQSKAYIPAIEPTTLRQIISGGNAPKTETGFIYFIAPAERDPIKVGFTRDLRKRFISYVGHSPVELALIGLAHGTERVERTLHGLFKLDRQHGEWFEATPELVSIVETYRYMPGQPILEMEYKLEEGTRHAERQYVEETTVLARRKTAPTRVVIPWMSR